MPEKAMGQTGAITALGVVPLLAIAGVSGLISWAGFNWASKSKETAPKILGYGIGGLAGLSALGSILGAIFWATLVHVGQAAREQSSQQSADLMQRADADFQRSVEANRAEMERFMNQNQQPSVTEQFSSPMSLPTTPLPM